MAKAAKERDVEITERTASKFLNDILARYENIETARGKFMNLARREREGMQTIYETMAQKGISQKASKTNIKIARALQRIRTWLADLEIEDRKLAQRLAKAQGDRQQLSLFADLKPPTKAELKAAERKAEEKKEPAPLKVVENEGGCGVEFSCHPRTAACQDCASSRRARSRCI